MQILQPGTPTPDFTLPAGPGEPVSRRDFRGRAVILAFYPADWSPVCGDRMALYNEILPEFEGVGAQLLGVSVDGPWCHAAFASHRKLRFPLLADFEPKGDVRPPLRRLPRRRRHVRARPVRHRPGRRRPLEPPVAGRRQPRRRRHPRRPRIDGGRRTGDSRTSRRHGGTIMKLDVSTEQSPRLAVPVSENDHAQGPPDAAVTLVEYGDYECPYCGNAYPIVQRIQKEMGDRLRFVFRNFPLNTVHAHASVAAQAAEAAAAQGKFWEMHDLLYEHQQDLADADMTRYALKIGLEVYRFQSDLSGETFSRRVSEDFRGGVRSGVNGTPTFFINGARYDGPHDYDSLKAALERAARE